MATQNEGGQAEFLLDELIQAVNKDSLDDVVACFNRVSKKKSRERILKAQVFEDRTILFKAILNKNLKLINFLLDKGADPKVTDSSEQTPLHYACDTDDEDNTKIVIALLDRGANIDAEDEHHQTPLHRASEMGNESIVKVLLDRRAKTDILDNIGDESNLPIHVASISGYVSVVKVFIDNNKDSVDDTNAANETALHCACANGHFDLANYLLDSRAKVNSRARRKTTPLHVAAISGYDDIVTLLIKKGKAEVDVEDDHRKTPLDYACDKGHFKVVEILLQLGATVGSNTMIIAIDQGFVDCAMAIVMSDQWEKALKCKYKLSGSRVDTTPFRELIKKMPDVAEEVLNQCVTRADDQQSSSQVSKYTFNYMFLEDFQTKRNRTKKQGSYTFSNVQSETVKERWLKRTSFVVNEDGKQEPIELEERDAENMENFNDGDEESLMSSVKDLSLNQEAQWRPIGFRKSNHPLNIMVKSEQLNLLKHPLVGSLLHYKWRRFGQLWYFFNLVTFIVYLAVLTAFALVVFHPLDDPCINAANITCDNTEVFPNSSAVESCCSLSAVRYYFLHVAAVAVAIMALLRLVSEVVQLVQLRQHYFWDFSNWIEVTLFICSVIFVWIFHNRCLCPFKWQWHFGILAVFLGWISLVIFIQKFPLTGIYVLMFVSILITYLKAIVLFALLIIAFSLTFYMVFYDPQFERSPFSNVSISIVKALSMTSGDYDFDSFFRFSPSGDSEGQQDVPFLIIAVIFWIIFIILMPILLINMLVGLAVDDIQGIQEAAALKKLALQVELVLNLEELLPWRHIYTIKEKVVSALVKEPSWYDKFLYFIWGGERYDTPGVLDKFKFNFKKHSKTDVIPSSYKVKRQVTRNKGLSIEHSEIVSIKNSLAKLEKLMKKMATKQDIVDSDDEDPAMTVI